MANILAILAGFKSACFSARSISQKRTDYNRIMGYWPPQPIFVFSMVGKFYLAIFLLYHSLYLVNFSSVYGYYHLI